MRVWGPADRDKVGELRFRVADWTGLPCPTVSHLTIEHADPVTYIAFEILEVIRRSQGLDGYPASIDGDLLTLTASNRTVIYRLGEYDSQRHAYLMTWPD